MELAISGWEAWYLTQVTTTEFVVLSRLIGWPIMAAWIFLLVFYLRFRLDPLDYVLGRRSSSLGRTDPLRLGDRVTHPPRPGLAVARQDEIGARSPDLAQ